MGVLELLHAVVNDRLKVTDVWSIVPTYAHLIGASFNRKKKGSYVFNRIGALYEKHFYVARGPSWWKTVNIVLPEQTETIIGPRGIGVIRD